MLTFFTFPLHLHVGKHFIISTFLHLQFFLQPFWHPNFLNTVLFTMLWKQLNSLAMHPKISFNRNMKESAKKQCFAPFQSYMCSNSIHRYATSVKYSSWHDGDSHITINFQEIRHVCNQNYDHLHHLFARKYLLDRIFRIESGIFIFANVPFKFFCFLLQPWFCFCNMPFLIFYPPSRDKTHVCYHFFLENLM